MKRLLTSTIVICAIASSQGHAQWKQTNGPYCGDVRCFAVSGPNLFAGTNGAGVFLSTNNGTSWADISSGLRPSAFPYSTSVQTLELSETDLFAGLNFSGVWSRPLSEMITEVESSTELPTDFKLYQNYPNPFNPTTVINYQLAVGSQVTLKVYDVLGNEIATLVNEEKSAGNYEVMWNASRVSAKGGYASGVYFYQLKAGNFVATKKMILLR